MTTMNHEWNVGQVGILHGEKGLRPRGTPPCFPFEVHTTQTHLRTQLLVSHRLSGHQSPTLFSSRPKFHHSYLEYYHDLFALKVERGDALIFDGSLPHGQGAIEDEDTWSIFVTLHDPGTFTEGFPNASVNQSVSIYRALTTEDHGWDENSLQHFYDYPLLLQQVCFRHRFMIT